MVLHEVRAPLLLEERPLPSPAPGEIRLAAEACAVCRTDLHVVDGDLPNPKLSIIPGHEIVGQIDALGEGVTGFRIGERVGILLPGHTCGHGPAVPRAGRTSATSLCSPATPETVASPPTRSPTRPMLARCRTAVIRSRSPLCSAPA